MKDEAKIPNIFLYEQFGGSVISGNTVAGASVEGFGAIGVELSDDVTIKDNDLTDNSFIPGWSVPGLETSGAYLIIDSTNVRIKDEMLPALSLLSCQVLHVPEKDASNQIDPNLIECEAEIEYAGRRSGAYSRYCRAWYLMRSRSE